MSDYTSRRSGSRSSVGFRVHTFPAGLYCNSCVSRPVAMYQWTTAACPECSSSTRSQPTTAWPRNSCTAAVALVADRLHRITYKLCLIVHLVHTKRAPQYLSDSVQTVACSSSRPGLRSSSTAVYAKPRCRTKFGERGFSHAGPTAWNSLPSYQWHWSFQAPPQNWTIS